mgnify:CR=1 FL=1
MFGFWDIAYWIAYWSHCFCFYHSSVAISGQAAQAAQPFGGSEINNSLVTMSSTQGLRTSVKRLSAGLPENQKKQKTPTVKTLNMNIDASCNTVDLDVKTLTGETITLKIVEDCLNLDFIIVKTLAGETITLDVKASSLSWLNPVRAKEKDALHAQLQILIEEFNKILHQVVYVSLTSLMVTIGKVKAIHILLAPL